jgi:aminobenzoyl-glutamate transport protein
MHSPTNPTGNPSDPASPVAAAPPKRGILDLVERVGNALPEPALLFALLAAVVVVVSGIGSAFKWSVQPVKLVLVTQPVLDAAGKPTRTEKGAPMTKPVLDERGRPKTALVNNGNPIAPRSLMTVEGVYWMLSSMIKNFTNLPALGLVFVAMLGIGVAEKFGLFGAFMRALALATPKRVLTPMIVFIGANSSVASDAGYIILPPLAAALYLAVGRHPVAGLAAAFCGVAGGFGGGFFPTAADGFLAGTATQAAQIIDPVFRDVLATHNIYFKAGSAFVVMLAGWFVTDKIVEPRLQREFASKPGEVVEVPAAKALSELMLKPAETKGLLFAGVALMAVVGVFGLMVSVPGAPLQGVGLPTLANGRVHVVQPIEVFATPEAAAKAGVSPERIIDKTPLTVVEAPGPIRLVEAAGDRWSQVIVPLILFAFLIPGMAYGWSTGALRSQKDLVDGIYHGIKSIVPVLGISFFLGQFVNYFQYTQLDRMLAYAGGSLLVSADLPAPLLIVLFVLLVIAGDFAMSGMLSKFGVMAPIFIPMFMMVGISPELTTAAYRIGDSVVNVITPLNSYLLIILVVLQKYKPGAGLGSLISLMLPYSVLFFLAWTGFLLLWYATGLPLGTGAPLNYVPGPP